MCPRADGSSPRWSPTCCKYANDVWGRTGSSRIRTREQGDRINNKEERKALNLPFLSCCPSLSKLLPTTLIFFKYLSQTHLLGEVFGKTFSFPCPTITKLLSMQIILASTSLQLLGKRDHSQKKLSHV